MRIRVLAGVRLVGGIAPPSRPRSHRGAALALARATTATCIMLLVGLLGLDGGSAVLADEALPQGIAAGNRQAALNGDREDGPVDAAGQADDLNREVEALYQCGQYADAIPLAEKSLALREQALGPEHPDTAKSLNSLAELYRAMGAYGKAEPLYDRALAIDEKSLGPEHPQTAISLNNLAALYWLTGHAITHNFPRHCAEPPVRARNRGRVVGRSRAFSGRESRRACG